MAELAGAITAILGVIALIVKAYLAKEPERQEKADETREQANRKALATGDVDAVQRRIDDILSDGK